MISASHNPYQDNGIKLIGHAGYKLPDEQEELLEKEIFSLLDQGAYSPPAPLAVNTGLGSRLHGSPGCNAAGGLDGLKIVADCANGSASVLAPELFERLGARVHRHPLLARRPQHQSELRLAASGSFAARPCSSKRRMSVSRSMAMPIALCSWRGPERSSMATRCCSLPGRYLKEHGQLTVERASAAGGGHRDVESGPGTGALRARDRHDPNAGGRQVRAGGDAAPWRGARRRAIRPHHFSSLRHHGRRHADGACGCSR